MRIAVGVGGGDVAGFEGVAVGLGGFCTVSVKESAPTLVGVRDGLGCVSVEHAMVVTTKENTIHILTAIGFLPAVLIQG